MRSEEEEALCRGVTSSNRRGRRTARARRVRATRHQHDERRAQRRQPMARGREAEPGVFDRPHAAAVVVAAVAVAVVVVVAAAAATDAPAGATAAVSRALVERSNHRSHRVGHRAVVAGSGAAIAVAAAAAAAGFVVVLERSEAHPGHRAAAPPSNDVAHKDWLA